MTFLIFAALNISMIGSLKGVELNVIPGDSFRVIPKIGRVSRIGESVLVDFGDFTNPLYYSSKIEVAVIYPESSILDVNISLSFSDLIFDVSFCTIKNQNLDLKFGTAKLLYNKALDGRPEVYGLLSGITLINAEKLINGAMISLSGGFLNMLFDGDGGGVFNIDTDGTRVNISTYRVLHLYSRGLLNIINGANEFKEGGVYPEVKINGNFNLINVE